MTFFRIINSKLGTLFYLIKSDAPIWFIFRTFYLHILHRFCKNRAKFIEERDIFIARCKSLEVDNDWFSGNIPMWLKKYQLEIVSSQYQVAFRKTSSSARYEVEV